MIGQGSVCMCMCVCVTDKKVDKINWEGFKKYQHFIFYYIHACNYLELTSS
jgi:hypothetical protein